MLRSEQSLWLEGGAAHEIPGSAIPAVISFINEKMDQTLTVRDLAEAVCMSESSFAHLFKTTVGVSPLRFLKQMRLEHARESLLNGSTVKKAASNVSCTSVSHFSSEFKRHFGESPKAYSKMPRDLGLDSLRDINHT
jgi:AraC-like DNA-binding protein